MATLSQKTVKVDRLKLIKALEGALRNGDGDYKTRLRNYEAALERGRREIVAQLERIVAKPETLSIDSPYRENPVSVSFRSKTEVPAKPKDVQCDLRNTIAVLKMGNEDTVTISGEQFGQYFPCEVQA